VSHLVYAASGADVVHVWVDGKQLLRGGELLTLDEERICYEAGRRLERLRA
jgi:5-methylthioadenosine/S-adenosylhomocysteine deaminase